MCYKRYFGVLTSAILCALIFTGCAFSKAEEKTESGKRTTYADMSDEELLQYLEDISDYENYFGECGYMIAETSLMGEVTQRDVYCPEKYMLKYGPGFEYYVDTNTMYGKKPTYPGIKVTTIVSDELRPYIDINSILGEKEYINYPGDKLVYREERDGYLYYATQNEDSDSFGFLISNLEDLGKEVPEYDTIICEIKHDIATGRDIELLHYAVKGDERTELFAIRRTFYEKLPEKEQEIKERIYDSIYGSSDQHTITIIAGKGTDHEKVYTETANADVYLDVWIKDSEGNYNLYLDSEYKEPYPYDGEYEVVSYDADKTIYMK